MFHLHITTSTGSYEKDLVHKLIMRGYSVAPAARQGTITMRSDEYDGALISLQLDRLDVRSTDIYDEVTAALTDIHAKYYSIIITSFSYDSVWAGSNFKPVTIEPKHLN